MLPAQSPECKEASRAGSGAGADRNSHDGKPGTSLARAVGTEATVIVPL